MSALGDRFWPALIEGKTVNWFGDPDARHTFTFLPDFARALTTLGAASDTYGHAWHVPSPETLTLREVAKRAAAMVDAPKPCIRRTPRLLLRLVGLAQPAAAEMIEMEYSFASDVVMSHHAWDKRFGPRATAWEPALRSTLDSWTAETAATSGAA